jgi:ribonuclease HI
MTELYVDGGCTGNQQPDLAKRKMVAVVANVQGSVVREYTQSGGSNNIAELLAIYEALSWCVANKIPAVRIYTDSRNNLAWVLGRKLGKKLNDRASVVTLKSRIDRLRESVTLSLVWIPREENKAGHVIEQRYGL